MPAGIKPSTDFKKPLRDCKKNREKEIPCFLFNALSTAENTAAQAHQHKCGGAATKCAAHFVQERKM